MTNVLNVPGLLSYSIQHGVCCTPRILCKVLKDVHYIEATSSNQSDVSFGQSIPGMARLLCIPICKPLWGKKIFSKTSLVIGPKSWQISRLQSWNEQWSYCLLCFVPLASSNSPTWRGEGAINQENLLRQGKRPILYGNIEGVFIFKGQLLTRATKSLLRFHWHLQDEWNPTILIITKIKADAPNEFLGFPNGRVMWGNIFIRQHSITLVLCYFLTAVTFTLKVWCV